MKRIIVCCDGTWNKPGITDRGSIVETNVEKIYDVIDNSKDLSTAQVKFYGQGVGTGFSRKDQFLGGGTGLGIDRNIQDAYKFIMWSYKSGDELYLFGFSRGAYTVRSLAGLIRNCGVMKPEFLHLVDEAYHLYRDRTSLTHPESDLMKAFKKSYGVEEETKIKFMGVWDTVGALGIPLRWFNGLNKKYEFHDVKLSSQIKYAYHALAIDERRKIFEPTLWEVSESAVKSGDQICEQVWFPGVHSNVGGGWLEPAVGAGTEARAEEVGGKNREANDALADVRHGPVQIFLDAEVQPVLTRSKANPLDGEGNALALLPLSVEHQRRHSCGHLGEDPV